MSAISFVCLLRDAGPHLLNDAIAHAQNGDQIVLLDDSGDSRALARIRERQLSHDIPNDVEMTPIVTGSRAAFGTAVQLGFSAATRPNAILMAGQTRLTKHFGAARDMANGVVVTGPTETPDIYQMILPPSLVQASTVETLWSVAHHVQIRSADAFMSKVPPVDDDFVAQIKALLAIYPDAAKWAETHSAAWTSRCTPGARIVHANHTPVLRAAPPIIGGSNPAVYLAGPHANRCPLSYSALSPLWGGNLTFVDTAKGADVVVYTHPQDVENADENDTKSSANYVLFSEEPFWDSLFSPDPTATTVTLPMAHFGLRAMPQVNHHTSEVYNFDFIPYYLLTHPRFLAAYQRLFKRNAAVSPQDWRSQFDARSVQTAFMAERRTEDFHDLEIPAADIKGLCAWRTRLAEQAPGDVQRLGASWQGGRTRFQVGDWHRDKLAQLDGQARLISAIENTHQPTYVSEKLFDAFACAARPIYVASPQHLVAKLEIPTQSWVNLTGLSSSEAATSLANLAWDNAFYQAYSAAQLTLCALFHDDEKIAAETARLRLAVISEIERCA